MNYKMRITETVKTRTGERVIEVEGEVTSIADKMDLIGAVADAVSNANPVVLTATQQKKAAKALKANPEYGVSSGKVEAVQSVLPFLEQTPSNSVSSELVEEVKQMWTAKPERFIPLTSQTGVFHAPIPTSDKHVELGLTFCGSAEQTKDVPPPMFSPETMKQLEERKNGVKPAPIVPQVAPFAPNAPTVLPTMFNPNPVFAIDHSQKPVPFDPPTVR